MKLSANLKISIILFVFIFFIFSCKTQDNAYYRLSENEKNEIRYELEEMFQNDQKYRHMLKDLSDKKRTVKETQFKDSLHALQERIDLYNTKRLIELTKKYGFPNKKRFNIDKPVFIIFVHSPISFKNKIKKTLKNEVGSERLTILQFDWINWHLDERKKPLFNIKEIND